MDSVLGKQLLCECELDNVVDPDIYKPQVSGAFRSIHNCLKNDACVIVGDTCLERQSV